MSPRFYPAGEGAVLVEFEQEVSPRVNDRVRALYRALEEAPPAGVVEAVPAFCSVLVYYDPAVAGYRRMVRRLKRAAARAANGPASPAPVHRIPVLYGGEAGEDLEEVAALLGMAPEEVVRLHSGRDYRIYMLGFLPGFAYLGGLDPAIAVPRLATPRTAIPAGAVGIGGEQTGIYPLDSPGGWRLIGRTPLRPYDPRREPAILYRAGDVIRFVPVDEGEFRRIARMVEAGEAVEGYGAGEERG